MIRKILQNITKDKKGGVNSNEKSKRHIFNFTFTCNNNHIFMYIPIYEYF